MQIAVQAVQMILEQAAQQAQTTGVAPEVNPEAMSQAVTQAQAETYNPQLAVEREKAEAGK
jgi:hypothetical protein